MLPHHPTRALLRSLGLLMSGATNFFIVHKNLNPSDDLNPRLHVNAQLYALISILHVDINTTQLFNNNNLST